jgi:hypothetical protein
VLGDKPWPPAADTVTAQGVANPADLLLEGREAAAVQGLKAMRCGGTPAKPGFLRSKKCAQMKFCQNLIYLLILYKEKHYKQAIDIFDILSELLI